MQKRRPKSRPPTPAPKSNREHGKLEDRQPLAVVAAAGEAASVRASLPPAWFPLCRCALHLNLKVALTYRSVDNKAAQQPSHSSHHRTNIPDPAEQGTKLDVRCRSTFHTKSYLHHPPKVETVPYTSLREHHQGMVTQGSNTRSTLKHREATIEAQVSWVWRLVSGFLFIGPCQGASQRRQQREHPNLVGASPPVHLAILSAGCRPTACNHGQTRYP